MLLEEKHAVAVFFGIIARSNGNMPLRAIADLLLIFVNDKITKNDAGILPEECCRDELDIVQAGILHILFSSIRTIGEHGYWFFLHTKLIRHFLSEGGIAVDILLIAKLSDDAPILVHRLHKVSHVPLVAFSRFPAESGIWVRRVLKTVRRDFFLVL